MENNGGDLSFFFFIFLKDIKLKARDKFCTRAIGRKYHTLSGLNDRNG